MNRFQTYFARMYMNNKGSKRFRRILLSPIVIILIYSFCSFFLPLAELPFFEKNLLSLSLLIYFCALVFLVLSERWSFNLPEQILERKIRSLTKRFEKPDLDRPVLVERFNELVRSARESGNMKKLEAWIVKCEEFLDISRERDEKNNILSEFENISARLKVLTYERARLLKEILP